MRVRAGIVVEDVDERGSPLTMRVRCTESTGDVNGEPHDDRLEGVDAIIAFRAGGREYQVDGHGANGSERDILEQLCDAIVSVPEMSGMEPRGPVAVGEGWQRVVDRFPATWVSDSPGVTRVGTVPVNGRVVKTEECDGLRCLRVELSLRRDGYWRGVLDVYGAIVGSRVEEDLELLVPVDGSARLPWSRRVSKWVVVSKGRDDAGGVGVCHQRYEAVSNVRMSRVPSPTGTEQLKDDRNEPNH
jgi:hypothetical protein